MKILNFFLTFLFILFAYFQYNDPDPWLWILLYLFVAIISGFAAFQKYNRHVLLTGFGICLIWMATLIPDFIHWIKIGTPNIASEMKTEEPHIELVREFLGLGICAGVLFFHWKKARF